MTPDPDTLAITDAPTPRRNTTVGSVFIPWLSRAHKQGLGLTAFYTLLRARKPVGLTDLYADLDVSPAAVTQMVRKLRRRGLVEFTEHWYYDDHRMKCVVLTERGAALLSGITNH